MIRYTKYGELGHEDYNYYIENRRRRDDLYVPPSRHLRNLR